MVRKQTLGLFAILVALFSVWYPDFLRQMNERYERLLATAMVATGYDLADTEGWNTLYQQAPNEHARLAIKKVLIEQALAEAIEKGHGAEQVRKDELRRLQDEQ